MSADPDDMFLTTKLAGRLAFLGSALGEPGKLAVSFRLLTAGGTPCGVSGKGFEFNRGRLLDGAVFERGLKTLRGILKFDMIQLYFQRKSAKYSNN